MDFRRLDSVEDPLFAEAFSVYEISFPRHEQRRLDQQAALMAHPLYHFDVIVGEGACAGILLHWEGSGYEYIEHFAIHPSMRGKAMGSEVLKAFCGGHPFVVLEIDPPADQAAVRREGFYQRLGFRRNGFSHAHPAYRKSFSPHTLVVMSYPERMTEEAYGVFRRELETVVMEDAGRGRRGFSNAERA